MATTSDSLDPPFDLQAQIARIDRIQAMLGRQIEAEFGRDRRSSPLGFLIAGMAAGSAFFAAGVAFGFLFLN